jgi:hypothetical protein
MNVTTLEEIRLFQNFENCRYIKHFLISWIAGFKTCSFLCHVLWESLCKYLQLCGYKLHQCPSVCLHFKLAHFFCHALWEANCVGGKIEKSEIGWTCGVCGGGERCAQGLEGKPEGKRPLGRPRRRLEDNIKMDFQEVGGGCGDWME